MITPPQMSQAESVPTHPGAGFRAGLLRGLLLGCLGLVVMLYAGTMMGLVEVSVASLPALVELWYWAYENLRAALVPFVLILVWFGLTAQRLKRTLLTGTAAHPAIYRLDKRLDLLTGLFFGVGVIWTAIGMRSALIAALGGLDAEAAAQLGAFGVLQALVDGGILLALSTTIVGGVGGYLLRLTKLWWVGDLLDQFYAGLQQRDTDAVLARLAAIEQAVLVSSGRGQSQPANVDTHPSAASAGGVS